MKIANNLITSIACYRKHFEFYSVWWQLKIFLRDMSPQDIPYPDAESEVLYDIIKDPSIVNIKDGKIVVGDSDKTPFQLNNAESLQLQQILKEAPEDRIRILALFELAKQRLTDESFTKASLEFDGTQDVVLTDGLPLNVVAQDYTGLNLTLRLIRVDAQSACPSIVGGHEINAGRYAYGLFSQFGLHKVLSPIDKNNVYTLKLSVNEEGKSETRVTNRRYGTKCRLKDVKSFCVIGENDYAYILKNQVYCLCNQTLNGRIKDTIQWGDHPLCVYTEKDTLVVIMNDGSSRHISLK